ncbi:MAG: B3/4 domain-containing protein [Bacillus sp. (in: firmicutes)]
MVDRFQIGAITYRDITVSESPQMVKGRLQLFQESLYIETQEKELMDFPGIKEWRQVFKAAGTDASRYRHSAEALYRRVKKQNFLPSVHSATDLNNFFSLQYQCPLGIYDSDQIDGDILLTIGTEKDSYEGINGRVNNMKNIIVSKDAIGAFGSPYVDSDRTKVTVLTKNAVQLVYLRPSLEADEAAKLTKSVMDSFLNLHGGEGSFSVIK